MKTDSFVPNPTHPGARHLVTVTDRALRYRARRNPPPGPKLCHYCGSRRNIEVEHINGHEEDTSPENLLWACRSCNTRKGAYFARQGIGRKTRQYNPLTIAGARTLREWLNAARSALGAGGSLAAHAAIDKLRATNPEKRAEFAAAIAKARKNPEPTFEQYLYAIANHTRGAHDEGGAIIHATSKATRSKYAREIARARNFHGTAGITGRSSVPF